jgi:acylphosphatase
MGIKRFHIYVSGLVQGVSYRANTLHQAKSLNISGWVKNLPDHRVEIMAEGDSEQLQHLVEWCKQGPRFAQVSDIEIKEQSATGEYTDFTII